ncbi:HGGxSTG domain-containing protein [Zhongshania sp.]|uniref:HGGxSTG domain-containing protein n=1 Tax=Zhongshania sp. TaxID=1971902 RepID=UPI0035686934
MTNDEERVLYEKWAVSRTNFHSPEACSDMSCGGRTRAGTACIQKTIYNNGRCKSHGGQGNYPKIRRGQS